MDYKETSYRAAGDDQQQVDIKHLVLKYVRYWKWFVLSVFVAIVIAFLYNRYSTVIYQTQGSIKILKDKDSGMDLSGLEGASSLFNVRDVNLENEIEILKSRRLLDSVVNALELRTTYYSLGNITKSEIWKDQSPFIIEWQSIDTSRTRDLPVFLIDFSSETQFKIGLEAGDLKMESSEISSGYNNIIQIDKYAFKVLPNPEYTSKDSHQNNRYSFENIPLSTAINGLQRKLSIEPVGKQSEVLKLTYQGPNRAKNEAIVNTLIKKFNIDGIRDKQLVSKRTAEFVAERSHLLFEELDTVESGLVDFKQQGDIVTIESTAQQLFEKESESEKKRFQLEIEIQLTKDFKSELENGEAYSLLPANLGIESNSINTLTEKYNEVVFQRQERLVSSTAENPAIVQLEKRLDGIKSNILTSISGHINDLSTSLENIKSRETHSSGRLQGLAGQEKGLRAITRQQEVKERLYLFLLQKREEAALQYAITSPTIKLVDQAYTSPSPIAPKSKIIYLAALILGGLIPFGILYLKFLLDTKISNVEDIKYLLPDIPIIAEIPDFGKVDKKLIEANDLSVLAESFRILRTNLTFLRPNNIPANQGEVIFVTSSIKGEGKTFTTLNLAHTLAATGKKILVIGTDLRNPQTHSYYGLNKNSLGLTNYLADPSLHYKDLLNTGDRYFSNLDLIISGPISPNPAELLINNRFHHILEETKKDYDYVIVDTAPTVLVTDTLLISKYADITVYIAKADYTDKRLVSHIKDLVKSEKLRNVGIVVNGINDKNAFGYNYGYGYGYHEGTTVSPWKFWKK